MRVCASQMFEKFSISDIDSAGRGGEYTVQAGFGWTNGVVLVVAGEYGGVLVRPQCPDVLAQQAPPPSNGSGAGTSGSGSGTNGARAVRGGVSLGAVMAGVLALGAYLL